MTLRCLILDDEPLAHEVILSYAKEIPFLNIVAQCYRASDAFEWLKKEEVDVIFLDIRMPKFSGLDFLKGLQQQPIIIITSAHEEYALESFDLNICDYLLKPFRFDRLLKAAHRALALHELKKLAKQQDNKDDYITIKSDKKQVRIKLTDLQYLESLGNYVKVWQNLEFILTARTLTSFEEQLLTDNFVRIHKSYILNKRYLHYLQGHTIYLKNGTQLPVGKSYKSIIKQLLNMDE